MKKALMATAGMAAVLISVTVARSGEAAKAQDAGQADKAKLERAYAHAYSPYAQRDFPTRPLFGDTHLHTMASFDAGAFGARLTPRDAYRFATGQEVVSSTGIPVQLSRPLDFLVVADHSDNMGMFGDLLAGKPNILADPQGKAWYDMIKAGRGPDAALELIRAFSSGTISKALVYLPGNPGYTSAWLDNIAAAEEYNSPGRFTAFIGYEWTSNTDGNNLHRNVIFRDNGDKAKQVEPYVTMKPVGSDNPRDLWKWMEAYEGKTGGRVLAIPHNGNLSNGRMFPLLDSFSGQPVDKGYATARERWERLVEATQTKGDGEAHPYLSPNDEFADFETWDKGNLTLTEAKTKDMLEYEYVRSGLKNGLKLERLLGINPYKFGLVGSSDAHTGLAAMEEDNFMGKVVSGEPSAERISAVFVKDKSGRIIMDWEVGASGYAAVWAKENSRASIWDAMHRRETYATTGSRPIVRFFGGWDFVAADARTRLPAQVGYKKGVPMGGDLSRAPAGKAPTFLVAALKDPIGANLDRYQIVKGWLDASGKLHEKVYDVVWSGNRKHGANGKLPPVGNTVDIASATWSNSIGAPELITVWRDPDFDVKQPAFYYGRVIEIPTPRWTVYDAKRFGVPIPKGVRTIMTERAYTSPIWYNPG
jgi:hypothetical protein